MIMAKALDFYGKVSCKAGTAYQGRKREVLPLLETAEVTTPIADGRQTALALA